MPILPDTMTQAHFQPQQPPESDEDSGKICERQYTGVFEGPEKTLEVFFRKIDDNTAAHSPDLGLRGLARSDLDRICQRARCTILSKISNSHVDAYVLSESSLFVYPYMIMLKTCGTTTLLRCMSVLIELGLSLGLEIDWVGYSRKNFNHPSDQAFPHQSFAQELLYLNSHKNLCKRLDGNGYTLGPVTSDHWFVFVADQTNRKSNLGDTDRVLNIMMFDIDESVGNLFYYHCYPSEDGESKEEQDKRIAKLQTTQSGIDALCPGAIVDARAFEPCGYSMNAILFSSYSTIHITPEHGSSYVSFETNQKVASYKSLINNVIRTFRPKRFVMTLMADEAGLKVLRDNPFTDSPSRVAIQKMSFKRSSVASIKVEDDCCCVMGNWALEKECAAAQRPQRLRGTSVF